jgi:hypothetical protein
MRRLLVTNKGLSAVPRQSIKVKVQLTSEQATKAQRGIRGIALLFP